MLIQILTDRILTFTYLSLLLVDLISKGNKHREDNNLQTNTVSRQTNLYLESQYNKYLHSNYIILNWILYTKQNSMNINIFTALFSIYDLRSHEHIQLHFLKFSIALRKNSESTFLRI